MIEIKWQRLDSEVVVKIDAARFIEIAIRVTLLVGASGIVHLLVN